MRRLETSTLSNQSLVTALLCHTYTADADRSVFVRLFADQIAGNGNYVAYVTVQRLGDGSEYRIVPITTAAVASGVTSAALTTIAVPVKSTDVLKVYLTGLAGDTTTPDIITEVWEDDGLRSTTADMTLDVDSDGRAEADLRAVLGTALSETAAGRLAAALEHFLDVETPALTAGEAMRGTDNALPAASYTAPNNAGIAAVLEDTGTTLPATLASIASAISTLAGKFGGITLLAAWLRAGLRKDTADSTALSEINTGGGAYAPATESQEGLRDTLPAATWAYASRTLTQSAASVTDAVAGSDLTIHRGDTWVANLSGLGSLAGRTGAKKLWFTFKRSKSDADTASKVMITEGAGMVYLNGAAGTASDGSILVTDEATGALTITIKAAATAQLAPSTRYVYDIQIMETAGARTITEGDLTVEADVTQATS